MNRNYKMIFVINLFYYAILNLIIIFYEFILFIK